MNNFDYFNKLRKNQSIKIIDIQNINNKKSFLLRNRSLKRNIFLFNRSKFNTTKTIRRVPYNNLKKNNTSIKLFNDNNRNFYSRNNNKIYLNNNNFMYNNKFKNKNKISNINKINNDSKIPDFNKDELGTKKNSIYNENYYSQFNDEFHNKSLNKSNDEDMNNYINKLKYNLDQQKKSFSAETSVSPFLNKKKMLSSKSNNEPKSFFQNGILNIDLNKDSSTDLTDIINSFISKDENKKNYINQDTNKSTSNKNKINRFNSKLIDILNADEKKTSNSNKIESKDKLVKQDEGEWFKLEYNTNVLSIQDLKINENINSENRENSEIEKIEEGVNLIKINDSISNVADNIDIIDLQEINIDVNNDTLHQNLILEEPKLGNKEIRASLEKLSNNRNVQELPSDLTFYN